MAYRHDDLMTVTLDAGLDESACSRRNAPLTSHDRQPSTLAMTLSMIRREVTSLRAEVASLDLPADDCSRLLAALAAIEAEAHAASVAVIARRRCH
jgi:hypothetical protein